MTTDSLNGHATNATVETFKEFDYVIVGGGPGGMACAAALSNDPNVSVGVLEAGSWLPNDPLIEIPSRMGETIMNPKYDWCLQSIPQKNANNRQWILPRGKMLGGSSGINFMCWQRGYRNDFDEIASLGNPGWDWNSLTPIYTALTSVASSHSNAAHNLEESKGTNGPISLTYSPWRCEAQKEWWEMMSNNGSAHLHDGSQSGEMYGLWNTLLSIDLKTKKRVHAGSAFYENGNYKQRRNLKILCDANATKVELDSANQCATGVCFVHGGKEYEVKAKREVILAAGTFLTPKLLELSGIGDGTILQKHNIPIKINNSNVGKNLQEHFFILSTFETRKDLVTIDKMSDTQFRQKAMAFFSDSPEKDLTGGFLGAPSSSAFAYLSIKDFLKPVEFDQIKELANIEKDQEGWSEGMKRIHKLQKAKLFSDHAPSMEFAFFPKFGGIGDAAKDGSVYVSEGILSQYPLSRGTVHVRSNDPNEPPLIDPNYFSNPVDLRLLAYALRKSIENTENDQGMAKYIIGRHAPKQEESRSIEEYEEFIRNYAGTTFHPVGTCSMMPLEMGGVVDAQLRVYGIKNLRIADASILPIMPSGHIQSTCYVIGHKAAEMMLKETGLKE